MFSFLETEPFHEFDAGHDFVARGKPAFLVLHQILIEIVVTLAVNVVKREVSGLPSGELATLSEQLSKPLDAAQLASLAPNMETRIEIYTASAIVIDDSCEAGKSYLANLASQLQLPAPLVEALHLQSSQSPVAA